MKKAYELATLTGTQVLLLVASETGHVYTFATPKLQPLITKPEGKNLIQACLNAPDVPPPQQVPPVPTRHLPQMYQGPGQPSNETNMYAPQQPMHPGDQPPQYPEEDKKRSWESHEKSLMPERNSKRIKHEHHGGSPKLSPPHQSAQTHHQHKMAQHSPETYPGHPYQTVPSVSGMPAMYIPNVPPNIGSMRQLPHFGYHQGYPPTVMPQGTPFPIFPGMGLHPISPVSSNMPHPHQHPSQVHSGHQSPTNSRDTQQYEDEQEG